MWILDMWISYRDMWILRGNIHPNDYNVVLLHKRLVYKHLDFNKIQNNGNSFYFRFNIKTSMLIMK